MKSIDKESNMKQRKEQRSTKNLMMEKNGSIGIKKKKKTIMIP